MAENTPFPTANREHWLAEEQRLAERMQEAMFPGGDQAIEKLAQQQKQPVRQLIEKLVDPGTSFLELGMLAGFGMNYPDVQDVAGGGVVTGIGRINGSWTMIVGNDSRVKAGAYFPITLKKHLRAQAIAENCGLNCVYIADSAGAFLPMQDQVFPDDGQFGSMFYNMCRMSAQGLKQITLSTGGNTAGGAYIVFLACESVMIHQMSYSFLGGPPLVKAALGEEVTAEELGGAYVHTHISGGCDHICQTQDEAIGRVRDILAHEPGQKVRIDRRQEIAPYHPIEGLYDILPENIYRAIDARAVIAHIADGYPFREYKKDYAPGRGDNTVCGKIFLKGIPVGVVASNNSGIIFYESAQKATEFIIRCGKDKTPLLFLQNSPGYMVGTASEQAGIGKYGANMVRAVSNVRVPRIQMVIGPDHGAANYGMCGRAYKPHFLFSTMRARTSVMSGQSAAFVLLTLEKRNRKLKGKEMSPEEEEAFRHGMVAKYDGEAHPFYCAARLYTDGVIRFSEIRDVLATAFEISLLKPIPETVLGNFHF
jgi:3-methylcrotonyl-CoA carboxylase beta subunit